MNAPAFSNASADLALAVYLEPHADQRRVLLLGQVDAPLANHLERLAAHLDIIDPSAREPGLGEVPELPFDDESFDLIFVAELAALPDPRPDAIRELRRVLARDGVLAVASPPISARSPEGELRLSKKQRETSGQGTTAEALERLLAAELRHVRILSQTPMQGYTLHDESARSAELSIDSSLVRQQPQRVERLVAIGSDVQVTLEARLWVQVPAGDVQPARSNDVDPRFVESLRKAEEEARLSLQREAELVRELDRERKGREAAEAGKERMRAMERKLIAIEADYDDAVARVRYFEGLVLERESATQTEQTERDQLERQLDKARAELPALRNKLAEAEAARDAALLDAEASSNESAESERRYAEQSAELSNAVREAKRHEGIARDLLEELRGLESRALVAVEHDARVSELEAERERAMQRALEAEVARESAQMRVDELRAQLEQPRATRAEQVDQQHSKLLQAQLEQAQAELQAAQSELASARRQRSDEHETLDLLRQERADELSTLHTLRGERRGLSLRLDEAEAALRSARAEASADDRALDTRLGLAEARAQAALEALGEAEQSIKTLRHELDASLARANAPFEAQQLVVDTRRIEELESELARAELRVDSLTRELEEADRFAEDHAEDAERAEALEVQLESARQKLDALDDDVRALQDELFATREQHRERERVLGEAQAALASLQGDAGRVSSEASARVEQLLRRESELRSERDDAHAALAEARAILSHLAVRVGADTHDLPAIMQALDQHTSQPSLVDSLRKALADAQAARGDSEYQMSRISRQLEESEARVRELETSLHTPQSQPHNFDPPEV